ncbi:MAG TPA: hypothetical protein VJN29_01945 [Intrasporangium sp.]|uniref:hypothetical protein n=1 Tax=Intrasporangium sp. TaxID=1925024 RepID=UPI002B4801C6|nr:hypothetical protein [Intrasporangium sp.]HKX65959.1 hypothetical protein [Intrasporangium sp.]
MSDIEHLIEDALKPPGAAPPPPSPDLFARVLDSVHDDQARRRRLRRDVAAWVAGVAAATTLVLVLTPRSNGELHMPWWILEVATNLALVAIALWLGPFIKRFGRAYAADVFHDNPLTGKSYIVLTDIVYYLIFSAYILFTVRFAPQSTWNNEFTGLVTAEQLTVEVARIGGILLIIGILHGLNIVLMPVLGRLFSLNRRVDRHGERLGDRP